MKYKVGDMVIVNGEEDGNTFYNAIGQIVDIAGELNPYYSVDFATDLDEHPDHFELSHGLHRCGGAVPTGTGWNVSEDKLSPYVLKSERTLTLYRKKLRTE